ncbi:hypothetical protein HPP92_015384 [Vanilla planifolia]|uniref:Uncharacterized protein n=1 Tax=Vanilla planifolia TaxID=51239 RepID=A0A835QWD2_VANPL|nr:hypothetical protein HPP92_015384 [Vanilla planifolia]
MACDAENDPSAAGGGDVNDVGESGRDSREASPSQEEVPQRLGQDRIRPGIRLQEPSRSRSVRDLAQDLELHRQAQVKEHDPDAVQTLLDQRGGGGRSCGSEEALVPVVVVESSTGAAAEASVPPAPQTEAEAAVPSATIAAPGVEEEAVRICLAPMFKELVKFVTSGATMVAEPPASVMPAERYDRWRRHRIMELELHLKRVNLVEEFVRSALEKLRSLGS